VTETYPLIAGNGARVDVEDSKLDAVHVERPEGKIHSAAHHFGSQALPPGGWVEQDPADT